MYFALIPNREMLMSALRALINNSFKSSKFQIYLIQLFMGTTNKTILFYYNNIITNTPSVPLCLSFIQFWDVPKYCSVSKNKNY